MKRSTLVLLAVTTIVAGCSDPARPLNPAPIHALDPSASSSTTRSIDEIGAAIGVLADAALRAVPALSDTPVRPRLGRELGEAGVALVLRDWARVRRALDGAQTLLDRYAGDASVSEEADLAAIQLAIDHARTLLPL